MKDEDTDTTNKVCAICLEPIEKSELIENYENDLVDDSDNNIVLECHHTFHKKCFYAWADFCHQQSQQVTCPICRAEIHDNREHVVVTINLDNEINEARAIRSRRVQRVRSCSADIFLGVCIFSIFRIIVSYMNE